MDSKIKYRKSLTYYIYKHLRHFKFPVFIFLVATTIGALRNTLNPYFLKLIINYVSGESLKGILLGNLFSILAAFFLVEIGNEVMWRLTTYLVEYKMIPNLRVNILNQNFNKVLDKNYAFYQSNHTGELSRGVAKLAETVPDIILFSQDFLELALCFFISIYFLALVHVGFALLLGAWVLLFLLFVKLFNRRIGRASRRFSQKEIKTYGKIVDSLSNIFTVKAFRGQEKEKKEVRDTASEVLKAEQEVGMNYFFLFTILSIAYILLQGCTIFLLLLARKQNQITVGDFALTLQLNNSITMLFWYKSRTFAKFSRTIGESKQALDLISTPNQLFDAENALPLKVKNELIKFKNITFKYPGTSTTIFDNFSLDIPAGQKVGIVGHSGGGKSTLMKLFLRFYDVNKGSITIDGQAINKVTQESLRANIGLVAQNPTLFDRSVRENIAYSKPGATEEEILEAGRKAYVEEFINNFPEGYDTIAGENGGDLSGGQRQRIAMARLILRNPPIVILDEATSQLDSITEKYIQQAMDNLLVNKTAIVIAHRLSTLLKMDRIIVLKEGKVVEDGTHDELLKSKGDYYDLWSTQVKGFSS